VHTNYFSIPFLLNLFKILKTFCNTCCKYIIFFQTWNHVTAVDGSNNVRYMHVQKETSDRTTKRSCVKLTSISKTNIRQCIDITDSSTCLADLCNEARHVTRIGSVTSLAAAAASAAVVMATRSRHLWRHRQETAGTSHCFSSVASSCTFAYLVTPFCASVFIASLYAQLLMHMHMPLYLEWLAKWQN